MRKALAALGLIEVFGCHKPPPTPQQEAGVAEPTRDAAANLEAIDASPHCRITGIGKLGGPDEGQDLDVGDGLLTPGAALVGVSRTTGGSRLASVLRVPRQGEATFTDLGRISKDVPPPALFARDDDLFAVARVSPDAVNGDGGSGIVAEARGATVFRIAGTSFEPLITLPPGGADPSAIAAVAAPVSSPLGAVLVWDEDAPRPASAMADLSANAPPNVRGTIRVALIGPDLRTLLRVDVASPDTTDAERPRVALRDGGFWVAWIARQTEPRKDAAPEIEGPGQDRAYRWVEVVALDLQGKARGPIRRLTSATGHASGFVMAAKGTSAESLASSLDVYVGLDDEPSEGSGGGITRVTVGPDGTAHTVPLVSDGVARDAAPWRIGEASGGWLLYLDAAGGAEHLRSFPLDGEGNPAGPSSLEPVLDDARPIAWVAAKRGGTPSASGAEILALAQSQPGPLRWFSCAAAPAESAKTAQTKAE
jgi:hypothetical protein